ncbi:TonB-dependent receptor [Edaphobacter flagellatus]|uniref:TonB-dependent receptor n=1 Tax=Edaphobacter flagellatus TaxID=1933044 RepID=UPI0021B3E9DB|nr:TonB-dependent receptor [Edaphobacter flagellatus]
MFRFLLVALLFFASTLPGRSQAVNATLRGTVMDATGSVVSKAKVELYEPLTGQKVREATSNDNGDFELSELKPGTYELRCSAQGFKQFVAQNIILDSGQVRRVNPSLALGATTDEVTVSAGAAVISTESPTLSGLFTMKQHDESPQVMIYPAIYGMLTTLAGVQGGTGSPIANGQSQQQQSQTFDGIANDLQGNQSNNANFFEQVSASLFNAPAESAVPVQINLVTKRGTNKFHGSASYRIYDSVFNARGYFTTVKSPYLQHEWNLEGGGYIWRDRTFFYGQWFAQKIPLGYQSLANVPTMAMRSGVFSTPIIDPQTGQQFPNNTIPASRISPVAKAFQDNYIPAPNNGPATSQANNYAFQFPFNTDLYRGDWPMARIDHQLTKNNSFFVRWLMRQTPYVLNNGLPILVWTRNRRHQQWAAGDTHLFTSQMVNEFRFGYSTDYMVDGQTNAGQTPPDGAQVLATTGLQGSNPSNSKGQGFPSISFGGSGFTALTNVAGGVKADNHITTFADTLTWQKGRHVLKFGGSAVHFSNYYGFVNDYGAFSFNGSVTKPGAQGTPDSTYADFLLGLPQQSQRTNPLSGRTLTLNEYGLFAQDSFKISPKLNIDYGLRWDIYGTPTASDHLMYNFDPTTGNVIVDPGGIAKVSPFYPKTITVQSGSVRALVDKTNVAPRIGAAYQITSHSVLRGGYGLYISRLGASNTFNNFLPINPQLGSTGPFSISETYINNSTGSAFSFPNPYPVNGTTSAPSQSILGYPLQTNHGHIHQFSATYEIEMHNIGFRVSYVGSRSTGLNYSVNINKPTPSTTAWTAARNPYPQFVSATMVRYNGSANYNGLQFDVRRRVGSFTFTANYSLSSSQANFLNTENPYNLLARYANDGLTRRHYSSSTLSYSLPFGHGKRYLNGAGGITDRVAGGWSTNVITYLASGTWFSPSFTGSDPSHTNTTTGLPDRVGDPFAPGPVANNPSCTPPPGQTPHTIGLWFNPCAFAVPQQGTFGNALPNSLTGQNLYQTHVSIIKSTPITERVKFNFITQVSNLFNHAQFVNPTGSITGTGSRFTSQIGTFGGYEVATPRQITFQGAFVF